MMGFFLERMLGMTVGNFVLAIGILLDIFGVGFLAVPDLPRVARRFRFGRLRTARDTLRYGDLTSDETGFEDIVRLHDESQPNIEITQEDIDRIEYGPKRRWIFDDDGDIEDWEINNRLSFKYVDDTEFAGLPVRGGSSPPEYYYPDIIQIIERGERKFRLLGLLLIGVGFAFQFASIWIV